MKYFKEVCRVNRSIGWALGLNVALLTVIALGFVEHFPSASKALDVAYQLTILPSVWGLYAVIAVLLLLPFSLLPVLRLGLLVLCCSAAGVMAVTVFVDSYIYGIYNYHINWFFIEAYLADEGGEFFDISLKTYVLFSSVAVVVAILELLILWLVITKIEPRQRFKHIGKLYAAFIFLIVLFANVSHSWAYAKNYSAITSIGAHIPFYFPIHSRSLASNSLLSHLAGSEEGEQKVESSIYYPQHELSCRATKAEQPNVVMVVLESWRGEMMNEQVTPYTYALAQESLWFKEHHSSGNVTTKGIFALLYGLVPTYMENVVANNGAGGPVFLNELKKRQYQFGIFPSGDITRIKLTDSSFAPVKEFVDHGVGESIIEKDLDVLAKMNKMIATESDPFFGFVFFNSSHYLYYYPSEFEKFTPNKKPSLVDFKQGKDPLPYVNRYKNSLYFIDSLIKKLIDNLKAQGKWENTVLIITSDHAEEFADTKATRFGHGSNFTRYQTHVPLIIHWPGKEAKAYSHRTASIDVVSSLLADAYDCENPMSDYSNGSSLFDEQSREVQVMASYYNYAFVTEQGSFTQDPIGLLQSKDNEDKASDDMKLSPRLAFSALEQMKWFYKKPED